MRLGWKLRRAFIGIVTKTIALVADDCRDGARLGTGLGMGLGDDWGRLDW